MGVQGKAPKSARLRAVALGLCAMAALAVASCESVDEGVSDYRKADINRDSGRGAPTDVSKKYALTGPHNGQPSAEASDVPIVSGDKFYVSLLQAYTGPDAGFPLFGQFGVLPQHSRQFQLLQEML